MIYLASPYSHPDPLIMRTRFLLAEQCCARLLQSRHFVYSPIVHCHELSQRYSLPTNFEFWRDYNFDMLRRADEFRVLRISGWDQSVGVRAEIEMARLLKLDRGFLTEEGEEWPV